jgi:hypothetical protein
MERSDGIAMTSFWCAITAMIGFTGVLSSMEEDDGYVERVVGIEALRKNAEDPNGWKPTVEPAYQAIRVTSVGPGKGVSEPITYEIYMKERARLAKDDFASSLKAMSAEPYQAATNTAAWKTSSGKPMASWDIAPTRTTTANSYWTTTSGNPMASWNGTSSDPSALQPYGTAYTPVTVKSGTFAEIKGLDFKQSAKVSPIVSYADTLKAMTSESNDKSKMTLPYGTAYMPVAVKAGTVAEIASPGASRHLDQFDTSTSYFSATNTVIPNRVSKDDKSPHPEGVFEFRSSMKRAILNGDGRPFTYRVEGYRFKPETKSLIHPDGVFKFQPETRKMIRLSDRNTPKGKPKKAKPINYPVEGFRFDETTKSVIQTETSRGRTLTSSVTSAVPSTVTSPLPQAEPVAVPVPSIVAPSSTYVVSVISDGASMNRPPLGTAISSAYKAMGSSYLDALNCAPTDSLSVPQKSSSSSSNDDLVIRPTAPPARAGLSYLESLGR